MKQIKIIFIFLAVISFNTAVLSENIFFTGPNIIFSDINNNIVSSDINRQTHQKFSPDISGVIIDILKSGENYYILTSAGVYEHAAVTKILVLKEKYGAVSKLKLYNDYLLLFGFDNVYILNLRNLNFRKIPDDFLYVNDVGLINEEIYAATPDGVFVYDINTLAFQKKMFLGREIHKIKLINEEVYYASAKEIFLNGSKIFEFKTSPLIFDFNADFVCYFAAGELVFFSLDGDEKSRRPFEKTVIDLKENGSSAFLKTNDGSYLLKDGKILNINVIEGSILVEGMKTSEDKAPAGTSEDSDSAPGKTSFKSALYLIIAVGILVVLIKVFYSMRGKRKTKRIAANIPEKEPLSSSEIVMNIEKEDMKEYEKSYKKILEKKEALENSLNRELSVIDTLSDEGRKEKIEKIDSYKNDLNVLLGEITAKISRISYLKNQNMKIKDDINGQISELNQKHKKKIISEEEYSADLKIFREDLKAAEYNIRELTRCEKLFADL